MDVSMEDKADAIAARYRSFAENEALGESDLYAELAHAIADSPGLKGFIAGLPEDRRQPNLFLAAVRHVAGVPAGPQALHATVRAHGGAIREIMCSRTTQTNEPGRCAALLPVLAALEGPLALLEVGASAGLCLLPDRYGYDYGRLRLGPADEAAPVFPCEATERTPLPRRLPRVVWRAGLDLNPLDPADPEQAGWLETLVWPGQERRAERLRAALAVARQDPPRVVRGNLGTDLARLAAEAPADARLVVFHTAVLAYVPSRKEREHFAEAVRRLDAVWISNESPRVFPEIAARAPRPRHQGNFLLAVDGEPVAWTRPHGQGIDWFAP